MIAKRLGGWGLLAIDRQRMIAEEVVRRTSVRVVELARDFGVTGETIRRDLELLERTGVLKRVHGGAVNAKEVSARQYHERETHRIPEKQAIGRLATTLVEAGDSIFIDVGTTALAFCEALHGKPGLTVITPSFQAALLLKQTTDARVIVTGGDLQPDEPYLTGYLAQQSLRNFRVQWAFVAVGGIAPGSGLSDFNDEEVQVRKTAMEQAARVAVLADSTKMGVRAFAHIGPLTLMDVLVTDSHLSPEARADLERIGVEVLLAHV